MQHTDIRFPPVLTKTDFVRRYAKGEFGNASPTWNTITEFLESGYSGLIHIRNRIAGGRTWYNVPSKFASDIYHNEVIPSGLKPEQLYFSAMAPTELTVLQGEVMQAHAIGGLSLFYSTVKKPMRDALKQEFHCVGGVCANRILQHVMCSRSYEWLQVLLERYPDHVVEFSTYGHEWGTVSGYNTVFWEVRRY